MHHLADAVPTEASTLWFLVISSSVQLACSLAVGMPVPISVVLGLPTEQESMADVGAQVCSNLRIADCQYPGLESLRIFRMGILWTVAVCLRRQRRRRSPTRS